MKNTTKQEIRQPTRKTTKATKNRITAFLLALLLVTTILSPQISVKAEDTTTEYADTTESDSDRDGGGHQTGTGGDGETSGGRPTGNDGSFETVFHYKFKDGLHMRDDHKTYSVRLKGEGHFNIRSVNTYNSTNKRNDYRVFVFSDMPFTTEGPMIEVLDGETLLRETWNNSNFGMSKRNFGNGSYYYVEIMIGTVAEDDEFISFNSPNIITLSSPEGIYDKNIFNVIENTLDLTKDDYKSDEDKANMTPVRDDSIGYLPRARYFDDRKNNSTLRNVTSTIQWDSFQEPYASDLDNPYYVEVYVSLRLKLAGVDAPIDAGFQYKKYGELKYVHERLEFPYTNPFYSYLSASGSEHHEMIFPQTHIVCLYVRLVHYDYEKQQVLCGGWTKLTPNENGGCTSDTGDSPTDDPNDFVSDDDDPKEWDDTGWEPDPNPDNPDDPDFGIDTSSIGAFIVSAITSFLNAFKSILSLVGEFPELCKHVFSFLPDEISTLMFGGVAAIIVMRFLGR